MSRMATGMLAKSLAGHDKNSIYIIVGIENDCVYLADGKLRMIENPKRKKVKHIQIIHKLYNIEETQKLVTQNELVKKFIKEYERAQ